MAQRLLAAVVAVTAIAVLAGGPAAAQSTTEPVDPDATGILPQPESGSPPDDPGDRGGWAQVAVLVLVVAGLAAVAGLAVRGARRARASPGPGPPSPG